MENKSNHVHNDNETCCKTVVSGVSQTLDEMDFERGIWHAALYDDVRGVLRHLLKGVSPNIEDSSGYTALHYAARAGHLAVCKILLEMGANVNAQTRCGKTTPLHRAAMAHHIDIMKLLLDYQADINIQDADGRTALHHAVIKYK